jgi:hypothetical protein
VLFFFHHFAFCILHFVVVVVVVVVVVKNILQVAFLRSRCTLHTFFSFFPVLGPIPGSNLRPVPVNSWVSVRTCGSRPRESPGKLFISYSDSSLGITLGPRHVNFRVPPPTPSCPPDAN